MGGGWTSDSWTAWANWVNFAAAVEEIAARLSVSAASISAPGLCLTLSWTSFAAAVHHSSQRDPLMMGSIALPELIAATVAQLSQKMRTVVPVRVESHSRAAAKRFQHSRLRNRTPEGNLGRAPYKTVSRNRDHHHLASKSPRGLCVGLPKV